ncbi:MAG: efflux RND transporter periplasmic adaptor subunit [bacterium]|jgi:RND family efflux transporter MFP subunit|nr:efflux RND transporter periplasmic adaptor subunit [bacterium]
MKDTTRSTLGISAIIVVLGVAGFFLLMHRGRPGEGPPRGAPARSVDLQVVRYEPQATTVRGLGRVQSAGDLVLAAQVGGRVLATAHPLGLKPGLAVPRDGLLCLIDTTDYALEVRRLRGQLRQSEEQLELARAATALARMDLERLEALLKADNASPQAVEQARFTLLGRQEKEIGLAAQTGPEGSVTLALRKAELQLERCRITAPFDLEVGAGDLVPGTLLAPGQTVARVLNLADLELRVPLRDSEAAWISQAPADREVRLSSTENSGADQVWRGRLAQLSGRLDPTQQTREAVVHVPGGQAGLRAGMLVEAVFTGRVLESALRIPRRALRENDRVLLWRGGRLEIAQVEVAWTGRHEALLIGGVAEGDTLVLTAIQDPVPGMLLRANGAPAPADGAVPAKGEGSGKAGGRP